jgi:hypothetical protein
MEVTSQLSWSKISAWRECGSWGQWPVHSGSRRPEMPLSPSASSSGVDRDGAKGCSVSRRDPRRIFRRCALDFWRLPVSPVISGFCIFSPARDDLRKLARLREATIRKIAGIGKTYTSVILGWQKRAEFSHDVEWVGEMIQEDAVPERRKDQNHRDRSIRGPRPQ